MEAIKMHYAKKLKNENDTLKEWVRELSKYVYSSKFCGENIQDKMINKNDIIMRINELENDIDINRYPTLLHTIPIDSNL